MCSGQTDQELVDYLASNLRVEYDVIDNTPVGDIGNQWTGEMFLTNTGDEAMTSLSWQIYFCCIRLMEYDTTRPGTGQGAELGDSGIEVYHVDGCLHKLQPMADFLGFAPDARLVLPFTAGDWSVSRTDTMPRSAVLTLWRHYYKCTGTYMYAVNVHTMYMHMYMYRLGASICRLVTCFCLIIRDVLLSDVT